MKDLLWHCIYPATACAASSLLWTLAIRLSRQRRYGRSALLLLASLLTTAVFWRLMDIRESISVGMIAVSYGLALLVGRPVSQPTTGVRASLVLAGGLWALWLVGLLFLLPFRMEHEDLQTLRSPGGRYRAALSYFDGLTYGYQRITLERVGLHGLLAPDEVVEVDCEGLDGIAWRGPRTLVVTYSCREDEFVERSRSWYEMRIVYVRDPAGPPAPPPQAASRGALR